MQALTNVLFLIINSFVGLPRHFPSLWMNYSNLNETHWTEAVEVTFLSMYYINRTSQMVMVFLLVAQMFGVAMIAVERFFGTFDILSFLHEASLLNLVLLVSVGFMVPCLFNKIPLIFQLLERLPRVIWIIIKCSLPGTPFSSLILFMPPFSRMYLPSLRSRISLLLLR